MFLIKWHFEKLKNINEHPMILVQAAEVLGLIDDEEFCSHGQGD